MADEGGDKRERRETSGPTINVLGTMEDVLSKLQLLNYEREYLHQNDHLPLARTAFSISTGNQATQFQSFVQLVTWLMDKCRMNIQLDWHDDTTSSCNNIYSALRDMQMPLEFPASKLRTGYGEACVLCLNFLCDRALMQNNFGFPEQTTHKKVLLTRQKLTMRRKSTRIWPMAWIKAGGRYVVRWDDRRENLHTKDEEDEEDQEKMESEIDPLIWKTEMERSPPPEVTTTNTKSSAPTLSKAKARRYHLEDFARCQTFSCQDHRGG